MSDTRLIMNGEAMYYVMRKSAIQCERVRDYFEVWLSSSAFERRSHVLLVFNSVIGFIQELTTKTPEEGKSITEIRVRLTSDTKVVVQMIASPKVLF